MRTKRTCTFIFNNQSASQSQTYNIIRETKTLLFLDVQKSCGAYVYRIHKKTGNLKIFRQSLTGNYTIDSGKVNILKISK